MKPGRAAIDWRRIRASLPDHLAEASFAHDAKRAEAILRRRTAQLAATHSHRGHRPSFVDCLVVRAAGARFALPIASLREIAALPPLARVPGAAATVRGVMLWRGEFVTLFDLSAALELGAGTAPAYAAVFRIDEPRLALAVETAERVARIDMTTLQPADGWDADRTLLRGASEDAVAILDERRLVARLRNELRAA